MIVDAILDEVAKLPDERKRRIIHEHTYRGVPLQELADLMGISKQCVYENEQQAINYLRRQPKLRAMYGEYRDELRKSARESATSPYRMKTVASFKSDFTSVVEAIVMRLV